MTNIHPLAHARLEHSLIRNPLDLVGLNPNASDPNEDENKKATRRAIGTTGRELIGRGLNYLQMAGVVSVPAVCIRNPDHLRIIERINAASKHRIGTSFGFGMETYSGEKPFTQVVKANLKNVSLSRFAGNISNWLKWGPLVEHFGGMARFLGTGVGPFGAIFGAAVVGMATYKAARDAVKVYHQKTAHPQSEGQKLLTAGGKFLASMFSFVVGYQVGGLACSVGLACVPIKKFFCNWIVGLLGAGFVGAHVNDSLNTFFDDQLGISKPPQKKPLPTQNPFANRSNSVC